MRKLLAKFKVGSTTDFGNNNVEANLTAVTGDSAENKTFSIYTPRADVKIHITNPEALDFFVAGEEYVCTFERVEKQTGEVIGVVSGKDIQLIIDKTNQSRR